MIVQPKKRNVTLLDDRITKNNTGDVLPVEAQFEQTKAFVTSTPSKDIGYRAPITI